MPGRFLPEREAAARLGVPPSTLKAMIKNGEIGAVKKGRVTMVPVSDIDEFLDQRQGRMAGDLTMSEVRSLDEFKQHLVRALDVPTICTFIKPRYKQTSQGEAPVLEIFFAHELNIVGKHVLLVEGLVHSGVTTEFLMSDLKGRGAASVKLVTLLDRQSARRVPLQPDYFGFLVDDAFLCGYGLGSPEQTERNLPYLAAAS